MCRIAEHQVSPARPTYHRMFFECGKCSLCTTGAPMLAIYPGSILILILLHFLLPEPSTVNDVP